MMNEIIAIEMSKLRERMNVVEEKIEIAGDSSAYGTAHELQEVYAQLCELYKNYQKMIEEKISYPSRKEDK